ncbi:uncharacterized protein LOC120358112 [Solenopsis invicta]|uniref:uncharacterized protein LOC120358112 n=1 Tax=Solenopsis invicta TaxID=13686 RepID=UPI00193CBAE5|nr:uncharacterized protein LOC120358112 [Solenopsis invicta]
MAGAIFICHGAFTGSNTASDAARERPARAPADHMVFCSRIRNNMSDNNINSLLTEWGLNAEIIANFVDIEIEQLDILTEEDLKLLIPQIGPRRKFQKNLKNYVCELQTEEQVHVIDTNPNKKLKSDTEHLNKKVVTQQETIILTEHKSQNAVVPTNQRPQNTIITTAQQYTNVVAVDQQHLIDVNNIQDNCLITISGPDTGSEYSDVLSSELIEHDLNHANNSDRYDLEALLKKSDDGLLLLRSYKNEGKLNNDS